MNKLRYIPVVLLALFVSTAAQAENYERVERRNVWNMGRNVTGLLKDNVTSSYAELYHTYAKGEFKNFSDASSIWGVGVDAKTISIHDEFSMIGAFSYNQSQGKEMCGSMFISPALYPFDLLEFTPGNKTQQSYYFMGGISTELNCGLQIGLKVDFRSQNYAKFKDLRHFNYRMELSIAPSVAYSFGDDVTLGLSYIYARNSEVVRAKQIGSSTSSYYVFHDKGLMNGAYENWEGTGVHLAVSGIDGFPARDNFQGAAAQFQWGGLYADVEYLRGRGEVGEKLTFWYDFPSNRYTARLGYTKMYGNSLHMFTVEGSLFELINSENVVGENTVGGVTTAVVYGSNKIYASMHTAIEPKYMILFGSGAQAEVGARYSQSLERSTLMYPYVSELTSSHYQGYASGMYPLGKFELRGNVLFSAGDFSDSNYQVESAIVADEMPVHMQEYYDIKNEYLTATYLQGALSVRYNHRSDLYAEVGGNYTKGFDLTHISGDSRFGTTVKIGYNF